MGCSAQAEIHWDVQRKRLSHTEPGSHMLSGWKDFHFPTVLISRNPISLVKIHQGMDVKKREDGEGLRFWRFHCGDEGTINR